MSAMSREKKADALKFKDAALCKGRVNVFKYQVWINIIAQY